jgi:hypothetical protein
VGEPRHDPVRRFHPALDLETKLHLKYLERDGVERDGSPGHLYGADEGFSAEEFRKRLPKEQRQFRFIVSPEDGARVDLSEFARQLMTRVENDIERRLVWAAVNHHNTDNPHVHIVVRGVDRDGDDLRIDGRYLGEGMRWRAQEILTREFGRRSEIEMSRAQVADLGQEGFTEIDRVLAAHSAPDGSVESAKLLAASGRMGQACLGRLQVLEEMQLATRSASGDWHLLDGWKEFLVQRGEDLEARARLRAIVGDQASQYHIIRSEDPVPMAEGVVVAKGLHDELTGEMFVAIKTASGQGYYLRLPTEVVDALKERDAVRVRSHNPKGSYLRRAGYSNPSDHLGVPSELGRQRRARSLREPTRPSSSRRHFLPAADNRSAMRHPVRIQPYVSVDLFKKLRAYAAARSMTVSSVITRALADYLGRDPVEDDLIVRRLDDVTHSVGELKHDLETFAVGFRTFAWYSFLRAPVVADAKVVRQAEEQYRAFVDQVASQFRKGVRFTHEVFPVGRTAPAGKPGAKTGGRDEEGRS